MSPYDCLKLTFSSNLLLVEKKYNGDVVMGKNLCVCVCGIIVAALGKVPFSQKRLLK